MTQEPSTVAEAPSPTPSAVPPEPPESRRFPRRIAWRPAALVAAFALLLASWAGSNPLGYEPDGPEHFVRSIGAGTGQFAGDPGQIPRPRFGQPGPAEEIRLRWINGATRAFDVPAKFGNRFGACNFGRPREPLTCYRVSDARAPRDTRQTSYVGTYDPVVYGVTGAIMAQAPTRTSAYYLGRFVNAGLSLLMLALAVSVVWSRRAGALSLVGITLAATPSLLFLGGSLGTNGVEAASTLCLWAVVLRSAPSVSRRLGASPRHLWTVAAISGSVCALSRSTGPVWLGLAAVLAVLLHGGPRAALAGVRRVRPVALPALVAMGLASVFTLSWYAFVQPHPGLDLGYAVRGIGKELWSIPTGRLQQWVGAFGWTTFRLPPAVHRLWVLAFLVTVVAALVVAGRRRALQLVGALLLLVGLVAAIDLLVFLQTRFPGYARYLLAVVVVVPLAAGEVLTRGRAAGRLPDRVARPLTFALLTALAAVAVLGVWTNSRRYAVGTDGPLWFAGSSQWVPPGGWTVWLSCTLIAGLLVVLAGLPGRRAATSELTPETSSEPGPEPEPARAGA